MGDRVCAPLLTWSAFPGAHGDGARRIVLARSAVRLLDVRPSLCVLIDSFNVCLLSFPRISVLCGRFRVIFFSFLLLVLLLGYKAFVEKKFGYNLFSHMNVDIVQCGELQLLSPCKALGSPTEGPTTMGDEDAIGPAALYALIFARIRSLGAHRDRSRSARPTATARR